MLQMSPVAVKEREEFIPIVLPPISDTYYIIQKRFGEEWHDLREWLTPEAAKVVEYASKLYDADRDRFILNCWSWLSFSYAYACSDYYMMKAVICSRSVWGTYRQYDFWEFPSELIARYEEGQKWKKRAACDCDGGSFLLASLLLTYTNNVFVNVGKIHNSGHAWVSVLRDGREYILETTLRDEMMQALLDIDPWCPVERFPEYRVQYKFDDHNVVLTP